jgi:hypothetical protein
MRLISSYFGVKSGGKNRYQRNPDQTFIPALTQSST